MGRETRNINFGTMDPHRSLKLVDKYAKHMHQKDFNLITRPQEFAK
jgi:hypothetical protein